MQQMIDKHYPMKNSETRQIRQVFASMQGLGYSNWDIVSSVVLKFNNEGRLNAFDEIVKACAEQLEKQKWKESQQSIEWHR